MALTSHALREFKGSLQVVRELLGLEYQYHDPPKAHEVKAVEGLRGAAAVLMVAGFEDYLKRMMEEELDRLADPTKTDFDTLPDPIRVCSIFETLSLAMNGPRYGQKPDRVSRIRDISAACQSVVDRRLNPEAFTDTKANPCSSNVKAMFKNVGVPDIFGKVKTEFDRRLRSTTANTFIADKLDEIVARRHNVAHTASALGISRRDLRESVKFLRILAEVLLSTLRRHVKAVAKESRKRP